MTKKRIVLNCMSLAIAIMVLLTPFFMLFQVVNSSGIPVTYGYDMPAGTNGYTLIGMLGQEKLENDFDIYGAFIMIFVVLGAVYLLLSAISFFAFSDKKAGSIRKGFSIVALIFAFIYNIFGSVIASDMSLSDAIRYCATTYAYFPLIIIAILFIVSFVYSGVVRENDQLSAEQIDDEQTAAQAE